MYKKIFNDLIKIISKHVTHFYGERLFSLVIFGSVARGTMKIDSDVDFLIIAEPLPKGRIKRIEEFSKIEDKIEKEFRSLGHDKKSFFLSPIIKSPKEVLKGSPLFLDMIEEKIILYDKDDFFKKYLKKLKKRLEILGAKKIKRGNAWFWVLKPDYKIGEIFEI
ncbi:MAG: nucleotidyltransferase domain-containing protein [Deltaproteobacteria bacterium]|nr:nucleotidyltransferase domain-containing protein [Deltaproteobacteria bacterium]